jgi:hypothetical protein
VTISARLRREVAELRGANEILRTASAFSQRRRSTAAQVICAYLDGHKHRFGVEPI